MPLPTKTLRETSVELGIPEGEIRALVDMGKIRAIFKKGQFYFAPDEIAKIKRQRKSLPDSAIKMSSAGVVPPPKPATPRTGPPPRPATTAPPPRTAAPSKPAPPPRKTES